MNPVGSETFKFMADLWDNNNKTWFDANRKRYDQHVRLPMKKLADDLVIPVSAILPEFSGKPKLSRINNDVRFHPGKPPYKEHVWINFTSKVSSTTEFFAAVGRNGWCAGCGKGAPKREPLDGWRRNLLDHHDTWIRYTSALTGKNRFNVYPDAKYKKALYPDIPEDLFDLVQAKGVWIVGEPLPDFDGAPEQNFFYALCRMLPIYIFMYADPLSLEERLNELGEEIPAPSPEIEKLWELLP